MVIIIEGGVQNLGGGSGVDLYHYYLIILQITIKSLIKYILKI